MHFQNNDTEIWLTVDGYTDFPEIYDEKRGKNALSCTVGYSLPRDFGKGILFDEIFQTEGIVQLYKLLSDLLTNKINYIEYKDEWDYFTFNVTKDGEMYNVFVNIIDTSEKEDINGTFEMSFLQLKEIEKELLEYTMEFPVIK